MMPYRLQDNTISFFFQTPATTDIYTLSLHDALPISWLHHRAEGPALGHRSLGRRLGVGVDPNRGSRPASLQGDRKSTRLNSSHSSISYAVFCLKKKTNPSKTTSRVSFTCTSCWITRS